MRNQERRKANCKGKREKSVERMGSGRKAPPFGGAGWTVGSDWGGSTSHSRTSGIDLGQGNNICVSNRNLVLRLFKSKRTLFAYHNLSAGQISFIIHHLPKANIISIPHCEFHWPLTTDHWSLTHTLYHKSWTRACQLFFKRVNFALYIAFVSAHHILIYKQDGICQGVFLQKCVSS